MLILIVFVISFPIKTNVFADSNSHFTAQELNEGLEYINRIRKSMGLNEIEYDPLLNQAAQNHADYIELHNTEDSGLAVHDETEGKEGFTGVAAHNRAKAAGYSKGASEVISFQKENLIEAVDSWMTTAYHNSPFTSPYTDEIGVGINEDGTVVLNASSSQDPDANIAVYPYDGQEGVGIGFYGMEIPNPLEQFNVEKSGTIITISTAEFIDEMEATITNSRGESIPFFNEANIYLYPKQELDYDETYTVSISYTLDSSSKQHHKTWSFSTMEDPEKVRQREEQFEQILKCKRYENRVVKNGEAIKDGQLGTLQVLKETKIYHLDPQTKKMRFDRMIKPGEELRIYFKGLTARAEPVYGIGDREYLKQNNNVKFEWIKKNVRQVVSDCDQIEELKRNVDMNAYTNISDRTIEDPSKEWTIQFSDEMDEDDFSYQKVTVLDGNGNSIGITLQYQEGTKKGAVKAPIDGYQSGQQYSLIIHPGIETKMGENIERGVKMNFRLSK